MRIDDDARGSTALTPNHLNVQSKEAAGAGKPVHVVVRLLDGDRVLAGSFADAAEAHSHAAELQGRFAQADGAWPLVEGRYLRPEAVVSVDVAAEEHRRWGGSAERAKIMDAPDSAA